MGRLAGFTNQKPQRRFDSGLAPRVKVRRAELVLASSPPRLQQALPLSSEPSSTSKWRLSAVHAHVPVAESTEEALARDDAIDTCRFWLQRLGILQPFPTPDWSVVDLSIAKELLRSNLPPPLLKTVLQLASPYSRETIPALKTICDELATGAPGTVRNPFPAQE